MASRVLEADPDHCGPGPDDRYLVTLTADLDGLLDPSSTDAPTHPHQHAEASATDEASPAESAAEPSATHEASPVANGARADHLDPFADAGPLSWRLAELGSGRGVTVETARRLACDCTLHRILTMGGHPVDHASAGRVVPARVRRALRRRDQRCQFPGCDRFHRLHAHHIRHWVDHGPTQLTNLVLLCPFHHRLVHEGDYTIVGGHPDSPHPLGLAFHRPDGTIVPPVVRPPSSPPSDLARATGVVTPHAHDPLDLAYAVGSLCDVIDFRARHRDRVSAETPATPEPDDRTDTRPSTVQPAPPSDAEDHRTLASGQQVRVSAETSTRL